VYFHSLHSPFIYLARLSTLGGTVLSCLFCVVSTSASDCLERLVSEMTRFMGQVGRKTLLNLSLTHACKPLSSKHCSHWEQTAVFIDYHFTLTTAQHMHEPCSICPRHSIGFFRHFFLYRYFLSDADSSNNNNNNNNNNKEQSPFIWAMGGRYLHCATSVIAGQYATSSCKPQPLLVRVSL